MAFVIKRSGALTLPAGLWRQAVLEGRSLQSGACLGGPGTPPARRCLRWVGHSRRCGACLGGVGHIANRAFAWAGRKLRAELVG